MMMQKLVSHPCNMWSPSFSNTGPALTTHRCVTALEVHTSIQYSLTSGFHRSSVIYHLSSILSIVQRSSVFVSRQAFSFRLLSLSLSPIALIRSSSSDRQHLASIFPIHIIIHSNWTPALSARRIQTLAGSIFRHSHLGTLTSHSTHLPIKRNMRFHLRRWGELVAFILFSCLCIGVIFPKVGVKLRNTALGDTIWPQSWKWGDELTEGGVRLVVFGDSWVDDTVQIGEKGKGRSWPGVFCDEVCITAFANQTKQKSCENENDDEF